MADHGDNTIVVYNRETIDDMKKEGGCGYWPIDHNPNSLHSRGIEYVLCIRNQPGDPDTVNHISLQGWPSDMCSARAGPRILARDGSC